MTLCYPGPIGGDAEVGRAIYGAEGIEMKREDEASAKKKMTVHRLDLDLDFVNNLEGGHRSCAFSKQLSLLLPKQVIYRTQVACT